MKYNEINLINLTPHSINLMLEDGTLEIPSEGLARAREEKTVTGYIGAGIPLYDITYGDVSGVPAEVQDTYYIVSALVAQAYRGVRDDILIVADTVRNEQGQIIGCKGFARI